jgi:hypothetical protein
VGRSAHVRSWRPTAIPPSDQTRFEQESANKYVPLR